jgi:hypothetical protein
MDCCHLAAVLAPRDSACTRIEIVSSPLAGTPRVPGKRFFRYAKPFISRSQPSPAATASDPPNGRVMITPSLWEGRPQTNRNAAGRGGREGTECCLSHMPPNATADPPSSALQELGTNSTSRSSRHHLAIRLNVFNAEGMTANSRGLRQDELRESWRYPRIDLNFSHRPSNPRRVPNLLCRGRNPRRSISNRDGNQILCYASFFHSPLLEIILAPVDLIDICKE